MLLLSLLLLFGKMELLLGVDWVELDELAALPTAWVATSALNTPKPMIAPTRMLDFNESSSSSASAFDIFPFVADPRSAGLACRGCAA